MLSYQWPGYEVQFRRRVDVRGITVSLLIGKVASVYEEFFNVGPRLCSRVSLVLIVLPFRPVRS